MEYFPDSCPAQSCLLLAKIQEVNRGLQNLLASPGKAEPRPCFPSSRLGAPLFRAGKQPEVQQQAVQVLKEQNRLLIKARRWPRAGESGTQKVAAETGPRGPAPPRPLRAGALGQDARLPPGRGPAPGGSRGADVAQDAPDHPLPGEVAEKSDRIAQLEREKAALCRQLQESRGYRLPSHKESTFI